MHFTILYVISVNGVYEAWSEWYSCSLSCGGGEKMRNRTCDGPYYGGLECNGSSINFALCNNHSCPSEFTVKYYSEALVVQPFKKIDYFWTAYCFFEVCSIITLFINFRRLSFLFDLFSRY